MGQLIIIPLDEAIKMLQEDRSKYDLTQVPGHNIVILNEKDMLGTRYIVEVDLPF